MILHVYHLENNVANTRHQTHPGVMLGQGLRRWANNKPALWRRLIYAGKSD